MGESDAGTAQTVPLPQLETFERMMKLPVVETAWHQGQNAYGKVKNSNGFFNWALNTTEGAIKRTAAVAAPFVHKLDAPIHLVDRTLVKGINKLETGAPIIKERPQQIYQQTKTRVMETVQPHLKLVNALRVAGQQKATTLADISMQKANKLMASPYGIKAVNGIDATSALAEKLIDFCFPAPDNEVESEVAPISAAENPLLHTIQTIGNLSNKISRRIYNVVIRQVQQLRKHEVQDYVNGLITVLKLTHYLNLIKPKGSAAIDGDTEKCVDNN